MRQGVWIVAALAIAAGCGPKGVSGSGEKFATMSDLKPDAMVEAKASLKIGQIDMPVEIRQASANGEVTLSLEAHGQTFEKEVYRVTDETFELVQSAGETYAEPVPILKFPLSIGDGWNWKGTMASGDEPHDATAKISTSAETLLLPVEGSTPSVLVVVDLSIQGVGPAPATRKLRFWFVKDKGLVKRQFGIASSREPAK